MDDALKTPLGALYATFHEGLLTSLSFTKKEGHAMSYSLREELEQYFTGALRNFQTKFLLQGSPFEKAVWQELLKIPYGQTTAYKEIASFIGKPKATRAVANAIGKNPLVLLIPCHRVIHKNGALGGYREGIERKQWILSHEMFWK